MAYSYDAFVEERAAWKTVIRLNLVRSVVTVLDTLQSRSPSSPPLDNIYAPNSYDTPAFTTKLNRCLDKLASLRNTKSILERKLAASAESLCTEDQKSSRSYNPRRPKEFFVRSRVGWRAALRRVISQRRMSELDTQTYKQVHIIYITLPYISSVVL